MNIQQYCDALDDFAEVVTHVVSAENYKVLKSKLLDKDSKNNLNIIHINIRSINKNLDQMLILIESLGENFDIMVLSETWIIEDITRFNITGYNVFYSQGQFNQNDGVVVYVNNNFSSEFSFIKFTENTFTNLIFKLNGLSYSITSVYRPPSTSVGLFLEDLETVLERFRDPDTVYVFTGDINVNIKNMHDNEVNKYLDIMASHGFLSYINELTRITQETASCVDHYFIKNNKCSSLIFTPFIIQSDITDHFPIILNISKPTSVNFNTPVKGPTQSRRINYDKLTELLSTETWQDLYILDDVDTAYNWFLSRLSRAIDNSCEVISIANKHKKLKPWITKSLIISIRKRDKLKMQVIKNRDNLLILEQYKKYRNTVNDAIRSTKREYYLNKINENKNDPKKLWDTINESMGRFKSRKKIQILHHNKTIDDDYEISNIMCNYFTTIGNEMSKNIDIEHYILDEAMECDSLFMDPTDEQEIQQSIKTINNNSASGYDNISSKTLKQVSNLIAKPLAHIFNKCFTQGVFPEQLKISAGTPVHKKGDAKSINNYRLISVISNIAKILEMLIKTRLNRHLQRNNLLSNLQFGFREGLSTEDAVYEVTRNIYSSIDNNKKPLAIFLDLAKAFDTIPHDKLLQKLYNYGIRGVVHDLFASYLHKRLHYIKINNVKSESRHIQCGIPQGTILAPILFSIYVNDLLYLTTDAKIVTYADDTTILVCGDDWQTVREQAITTFAKVSHWLKQNSLTINLDKTKFMYFSIYDSNVPATNTLNLHSYQCLLNDKATCYCNEKLYCVSSIRYLGVCLDSNLKYTVHMAQLNMKIRKLICKFYNLRYLMPNYIMRMLYFALVESLLRYCMAIWGGTFPTNMEQLKVTQKYIIKIILFKSKRYSSDLLFEEFNVLSLDMLYVSSALVFVYRHKEIAKFNILNKYETRSKSNLNVVVPLHTKTTTQRSITYFGPKLYNLLPSDIKLINNKNLFAKKVKRYITDNSIKFNDVIRMTCAAAPALVASSS